LELKVLDEIRAYDSASRAAARPVPEEQCWVHPFIEDGFKN